jgi:glycosyltransferase involved in cell wall biosynthesis
MFAEYCYTGKKFEIEVLISDDCSSDSTVEVINNFVLKNKISVTLNVNSYNKGVIGNLIELLKMCKGKYIAFCEGDDYWIDEKKYQNK